MEVDWRESIFFSLISEGVKRTKLSALRGSAEYLNGTQRALPQRNSRQFANTN